MDTDLRVSSFIYDTKEEAEKAVREQKAVDYLSKQLSKAGEKDIHDLYDKLIERNMFTTENGLVFLYLLRENLINVYHVDKADLQAIPVHGLSGLDKADKEDDSLIKSGKKRKKRKSIINSAAKKAKDDVSKESPEKKYQTLFRIFLTISIILCLAIGGMFYILSTSDLPTIVNYETKIQNKYSEWEKDLDNREKAIREKEKQLNITNND